MLLQKKAHSLRFDILISFLYRRCFVWYKFQKASLLLYFIEVSSALAFKIRQGYIPPGRFVLCFDFSVSESID